jgi:solute carrier family 25 protein 34/35
MEDSVLWNRISRIKCINFFAHFFLYTFQVKTQLQSQAANSIAVGYQHTHTGCTSALWKIYLEQGIPGLWRGAFGAMPRSGIGSASQLLSFSLCKDCLEKYEVTIAVFQTFCISAFLIN